MSLVTPGIDPATRSRLERSLQTLETDRHGNLPLLAGVAVSLMLHGTLLAPKLQQMLSEGPDGVDRTRRADFSVEKEMEKRQARTEEQKQAEDDLIKLGIEDGTTQSTMTWIGYNEYQQHLARLSEVDQAAFRDTDEGGQPMPMAREAPPMVPQVPSPSSSAPPAPAAQSAVSADPVPPQPVQPPQPPAQPAQRPPDPARPAEPAPQPPNRREDAQASPPPPPRTAATEATAPDPAAIQIPEAKTTQVEPMIQPVDKAPEQPEETPPDAKQPEVKAEPAPPTQVTPPQDTKPAQAPAQEVPAPPADPSKPQPPSPPQQPTPPTQAASGNPQPSASPATGQSADPSARPGAKPGPKADGDLSDRESDATSTVEVPPSQWRSGKPLAAKGLNVTTKRPVFDELTSISTAPQAPLAVIEFDREGKAVNCTLVKSSGFPNVDQAILDSLFSWRAKGKPLNNLKPGETVKFRIKLLLR